MRSKLRRTAIAVGGYFPIPNCKVLSAQKVLVLGIRGSAIDSVLEFENGIQMVAALRSDHSQTEMTLGSLRLQIGGFGQGFSGVIVILKVICSKPEIVEHFGRAGFELVHASKALHRNPILPRLCEGQTQTEQDLGIISIVPRNLLGSDFGILRSIRG